MKRITKPTRAHPSRPSAGCRASSDELRAFPPSFLETLEGRVLMSASLSATAQELLGRVTTTGSTAPIHLPQQPVLAIDDAAISPSTTASGPLINLNDFRADSLFAGIDGTGYSTVIIDTGIDLNHAFFGPDADADGVADRIVYHYDFADNDADAGDNHNHGSNVASIVASSDATYTGVAPGADIIALKVFKNAGGGSFGYVEDALQWVIANAVSYNIASVNMSLGDEGNYSSSLSMYGIGDELALLASMDVIVVAASGNDFAQFASAQGVSYPAADPNVIAVGAVFDSNIGSAGFSGSTAFTTGPDVITPFSQRDDTLSDIFAPGSPITGADRNGGIVSMSGTSQAAPHIAGVAILAQQLAEQELGRRLTVAEFAALIRGTGVILIDGDDENDNVVNTGLSFSRIDVQAMGLQLLSINTSSAATGEIRGTVWSDTDEDGVRDAGEPGSANWVVYLDNNQSGVRDPGEQVAVTDPNGNYVFTQLPAGEYHVAEVIPSGVVQTYPGVGSGDYLSLVGRWNDYPVTGGLVPQHGDKGPGGSGQIWADLWAEGDFVYLGHYSNDSTVDIIDISDPSNPVLAAKWVGPYENFPFADIQVTDGIGYFGSDYGGTVFLVDVSDPYNPVTLGSATGHGAVHTLYVEGDYLYTATTRTPDVAVYDVSNPSNPVFLRSIVSPGGGAVHEITVRDGFLFMADIGNGTVDIFDVSDVASGAPLIHTFDTGSGTHTAWANDDATVLAVARETGGGDVRLYDIEDPTNPVLLSVISQSAYGISAFTAHQPMIVGDRLYVAWYQAGIQAFDISDPQNPVHLGGYDTYPGTLSGYQGNWGVFAQLGPDRILAADMDNGLFILSTIENREHTVTLGEGQILSEINFGNHTAPAPAAPPLRPLAPRSFPTARPISSCNLPPPTPTDSRSPIPLAPKHWRTRLTRVWALSSQAAMSFSTIMVAMRNGSQV